MFDLGTYELKYLNGGKVTPEESFMNVYVEEKFESEQVRTYTKLLRTILDTKYERKDLNEVMKNQCRHST